MNATANGKAAPPSDSFARPLVTPGDLVAQARAAAETDRQQLKSRRDAWVAARQQIAVILSSAQTDCLAMERESVEAALECERLLSEYAPQLAAAVAALQPPVMLHRLPPANGVPGWSRYEQLGRALDLRREPPESRDTRPACDVPMAEPQPASEPPPDEPVPDPLEPSDPGPAQVPPPAENVRRLMRCPKCGAEESLPADVRHEICGACALEGASVPLEAPPMPPLIPGPPPPAKRGKKSRK